MKKYLFGIFYKEGVRRSFMMVPMAEISTILPFMSNMGEPIHLIKTESPAAVMIGNVIMVEVLLLKRDLSRLRIDALLVPRGRFLAQFGFPMISTCDLPTNLQYELET